jgi:hypothetical protein
MNSTNALELVHQFRESFGLKILRKHGIVNHGQSFRAELKIISNLSRTVLESYNPTGAVRVRPKLSIVLKGKLNKKFGSCINTLIFSSSVHKGA